MKSLNSGAFGICVAVAMLAGCGPSTNSMPLENPGNTSASFLSRPPALVAPSRSRYSENVLYRFRGKNGSKPYAGLIFDNKGALYGTTSEGGAYGAGTVFRLTPSASGYTESFLYSFTGYSDGAVPQAGLIFDKEGALYGTTTYGGSNKGGTVFKLVPSGSGYTERVLYAFCAKSNCTDGRAPVAGLVFGKDGALYGTTALGGTFGSISGAGTVFKLTPSGSGYSESVLYAFCVSPSCASGENPQSGVVFGRDGALYGTTAILCDSDPNNGACGTVFKLTPSGSGYAETTLYTFRCHPWPNCPSGEEPLGTLIFDKGSGGLYGTTYFGGRHGNGTVFKLTPSGSGYTESVLHSFTGGTDGAGPWAGLTFGRNGVLYGTTTTVGGQKRPVEGGRVFQLTPSGSGYNESVLHSLGHADPQGSLILDKEGALYGTVSSSGRQDGDGYVFKVTP
jgi:uncharacterized repeat protein (TIGR03803 family)